MTYGLDTSVIMRLVAQTNDSHAEFVRNRICELLDGGNVFFVSCQVASEAYYALQHHYGNTKEDAIMALRALANEEGFSFAAEAMAALGTPEAWKASPGFVDRMIAGEYASKGYVTLSCEKSFRHLDFAEVIKGA